jgi:uncharacterized protein YndB with AHSA1/START domain
MWPMTATPTGPSEREFVVEHHFQAPAAKVFAAYTDPHLLAQWWAPKGGSLAVETMDVRPGGAYRFVQREPNGQQLVFVGRYLEVNPVTRLVYTFGVEGQGNEIRATVDLKESQGKTSLRLTNLCASKEVRDMMLQYGAEAGARASWARLVELLARSARAPEA